MKHILTFSLPFLELFLLANAQPPSTSPIPADLDLGSYAKEDPLPDRAQISQSSIPSPYGPPPFYAAGWLQWPEDCKTIGIDICYTSSITPDKWVWAMGGNCLTGMFMPTAYFEDASKFKKEELSDGYCMKRIRDIAGVAENLGVKTPRVGYNLKTFPGDPVIKGLVTSYDRPKVYNLAYTGEPIVATEPSFVIVGYPLNTTLCYEYLGNPEIDSPYPGYCAEQDAKQILWSKPESEAPEGQGLYDGDAAGNNLISYP